MYEKELELAKKLAVKAGEAIMEIYNNEEDFGVETKSNDTPLTIADKAANRIIVDGLREAFPEYAILSEEEKDNLDRRNNDYCFIVDPLDGTKEFIKRNGQFTVNIALAFKQKSEMGVIYTPATGDLYYAAKGVGAFKEKDGVVTELHVTTNTDVPSLKVVMSSSHGCKEMDELIEKHHLTNFVAMGSSLKGCLIAEGAADVYFRHNLTCEWDTAAMQCIVEEAGGIFRQMDDTPMLYNRENTLNDKGFYAINCEANRLR